MHCIPHYAWFATSTGSDGETLVKRKWSIRSSAHVQVIVRIGEAMKTKAGAC